MLSPEQHDFKARRLKAIARRHRAYLRKAVSAEMADDAVLDDIEMMFD